jgi:hypothetical protein
MGLEESTMRVFLAACLAIVLLAVGGYFAANAMQRLSGVAYTTEGARINPSWSWRRIFAKAAPSGRDGMSVPAAHAGMVDECDVGTTWRWILVDFSNESAKDVPDCQ